MIGTIKAIAQCSGELCKVRPMFGSCWRQLHTPSVKEVRIPTDWGYLAGRWWGSEDRQPLLALHGWQDNAGTWDALVPHLPSDYSVLAIDFPGHGQSSWLPKGLHYTKWLNVQSIIQVKEFFKWEKVNFLAHSMGSITTFLYGSLYPENVNYYIAVENIIPDVPNSVEYLHKTLAKSLIDLSIEQKRLDTEPPSYTYEDTIMRYHLGTKKSVNLESAHYLVDRGTKQSKFDSTKYYFCRDSRLKHSTHVQISPEYIKYGIQQLKFPILYLKAKDSNYASDELAITCGELLAKSNDKYELHLLPGTHHLHLNNPEIVAPIITQFVQKYTHVNSNVNGAKL